MKEYKVWTHLNVQPRVVRAETSRDALAIALAMPAPLEPETSYELMDGVGRPPRQTAAPHPAPYTYPKR